jgi:hypothetical protein
MKQTKEMRERQAQSANAIGVAKNGAPSSQ